MKTTRSPVFNPSDSGLSAAKQLGMTVRTESPTAATNRQLRIARFNFMSALRFVIAVENKLALTLTLSPRKGKSQFPTLAGVRASVALECTS